MQQQTRRQPKTDTTANFGGRVYVLITLDEACADDVIEYHGASNGGRYTRRVERITRGKAKRKIVVLTPGSGKPVRVPLSSVVAVWRRRTALAAE